MSARNELAREITTFRERWFGSLGGGSPKEDVQIADHLLAAGYSKPRTITTAEELDALVNGSVVIDCDGDPWQKEHGSWRHDLARQNSHLVESYAPLTVAYTPEATR